MTNTDSISWREGYSEGYLEALCKVTKLIEDLQKEVGLILNQETSDFIKRLVKEIEKL